MHYNEYQNYPERPTLTKERLEEIWDLPSINDEMIHCRALARELHSAWSKRWRDAKVEGITSLGAMKLIDKATLSDLDAREMLSWSIFAEPEPPPWPCYIDHGDESFHEALAEDGWKHGDPEDEEDAA